MITALISSIVGLVGGAVPDVLKEWRESRDHQREKEFLVLQNELQLKRLEAGLEGKIQERESELMAEEVRATREHLTAIIESQARPTGIAWIDNFNSLLRPVVSLLIIVLFMFTAVCFVSGVLTQYAAGGMTPVDLATTIWGSLVGESILAVLGFLFGYRSSRKRAIA